MGPMKGLLKSRKFLLLVLDTVVSSVLFFVGRFVPEVTEEVDFLIKSLQPVFVAIIIAISVEDGAMKLNGGKH